MHEVRPWAGDKSWSSRAGPGRAGWNSKFPPLETSRGDFPMWEENRRHGYDVYYGNDAKTWIGDAYFPSYVSVCL
jgi:hypothetical protein